MDQSEGSSDMLRASFLVSGQVGSRFAAMFRGYPPNFAPNSPQYFAIITGIIFPSSEPTHWIWSLKILRTSQSPLRAASAHTQRMAVCWASELWWIINCGDQCWDWLFYSIKLSPSWLSMHFNNTGDRELICQDRNGMGYSSWHFYSRIDWSNLTNGLVAGGGGWSWFMIYDAVTEIWGIFCLKMLPSHFLH